MRPGQGDFDLSFLPGLGNVFGETGDSYGHDRSAARRGG